MIMMTMMMIMMMMIHRTANYRRGRGAANDEVMSFDYNDEYDDDKKHIEQDFATVKEDRTLQNLNSDNRAVVIHICC